MSWRESLASTIASRCWSLVGWTGFNGDRRTCRHRVLRAVGKEVVTRWRHCYHEVNSVQDVVTLWETHCHICCYPPIFETLWITSKPSDSGVATLTWCFSYHEGERNMPRSILASPGDVILSSRPHIFHNLLTLTSFSQCIVSVTISLTLTLVCISIMH